MRGIKSAKLVGPLASSDCVIRQGEHPYSIKPYLQLWTRASPAPAARAGQRRGGPLPRTAGSRLCLAILGATFVCGTLSQRGVQKSVGQLRHLVGTVLRPLCRRWPAWQSHSECDEVTR